MDWLISPGFFSSPQVHTAAIVGGVAAVVSAIVGVFTVIRGQSFAGHALTDTAATGGAAMPLFGASALGGFVGGTVVGAGAMEAIGVRHVRGRDLATGIVLGASTGLTALFLYFDTTTTATTGATQYILFGSIFSISASTVPVVVILSVVSLGLVALIYRPLLYATFSPDIAAARGVPTRVVGAGYMLALALAVALSSLAIGAILSTALLIGPPAAALRSTKRFPHTLLVAVGFGLAATWVGILLAYDSATWFANGNGLPVSFFIVALTLLLYLAASVSVRLAATIRTRRRLDMAAISANTGGR